MPLFPAVLRLVLKAEGIRSNPNFSLPGLCPASHGRSSPALLGRTGRSRKNRQAVVGDCLSELVIPLGGSHRASRDVPGNTAHYRLIWARSACVPGEACNMRSDCAEAFPFKGPAYQQYLIKISSLFALTLELKGFRLR